VASFESVNYALRPNKNVERKLVLECLQALSTTFRFSEYTYIGLGSMWFVDFILAHKQLLVDAMISIENQYAQRAIFNKPFKVIRVEEGETKDVLPLLDIDQERVIVWLDYDKGLTSPVLLDTENICSRAATGSIILVTINANVGSLRNQKNERDEPITEEEYLRRFGRDLIPNPLSVEATQTTGYPTFLGGILFEHIRRVIRKAGRRETFVPIFNYRYKDTSLMITIGGMIANARDAHDLNRRLDELNLDYVSRETQFLIEVPVLTFKEKIALDSILPTATPPTITDVETLGFPLRQGQIDSYQRFYRYYPTFAELIL
jgi:hypothetical protein